MIIKQLVDEDFSNYKKASMLIGFPYCSFKCEKDCGEQVCQNSTLATSKPIETGYKTLVNRYINNPITSAVVCAGLEPFDSWDDLRDFICYLRCSCDDDVVIYTGYNKNEIEKDIIDCLIGFKNIVVKFGRFIPNQEKHYDEVLGIYLVSDNQYAEVIS